MAQTKLDLSDNKFAQLPSETLHLSGCTHVYGQFQMESGSTLTVLPNHGNGKILTSNASGVATWQLPLISSAGNGLSLSGTTVVLGGTLTKTGSTIIDINNRNLFICSGSITNRGIMLNHDNDEARISWADSGNTCFGYSYYNPNCSVIVSTYPGGGCRAEIALVHSDNRICFKSQAGYQTYHDCNGLWYTGDYSCCGVSARWIPDKGYVDGLISGDTKTGDERITKLICQISHGFIVQEVIGFSGGTYNKAIANGFYDGEVLGIVSKCYNTDCFDLTQAGYVTGLTSLSTSDTYFLSDVTPGLLTTTPPTINGHLSKAVLVADSTTSGWVLPYPGYYITSGETDTITAAANGLSLLGTTVVLGGTLTGQTTIHSCGNDLFIGRCTNWIPLSAVTLQDSFICVNPSYIISTVSYGSFSCICNDFTYSSDSLIIYPQLASMSVEQYIKTCGCVINLCGIISVNDNACTTMCSCCSSTGCTIDAGVILSPIIITEYHNNSNGISNKVDIGDCICNCSSNAILNKCTESVLCPSSLMLLSCDVNSGCDFFLNLNPSGVTITNFSNSHCLCHTIDGTYVRQDSLVNGDSAELCILPSAISMVQYYAGDGSTNCMRMLSNAGLHIESGFNNDRSCLGITGNTMIICGTSNSFIFEGIRYAENYEANFTNRSLVDKEYVNNFVTGNTIIIKGAANGLSKSGSFAVLGGHLTGNTCINISGSTFAITGTSGGINQGMCVGPTEVMIGDICEFKHYILNTISQSVMFQQCPTGDFQCSTMSVAPSGVAISAGNPTTGDNALIDINSGHVCLVSCCSTGCAYKLSVDPINVNFSDNCGNRDFTFSCIISFTTSNYPNIVCSFMSPTYYRVEGTCAFAGIEYCADYSANYTNRSLVDKGYVISHISGFTGNTQVAAGDRVTKLICQVTHGFNVKDVVGFSGGTYNKPIALSTYNGEILGLVSKCYNTDCFDLTQAGYVTGLTSLSANTTYFLSDVTPGLLSATKPTIVGHIVKSVMVANSTTTAWILPYPGYVLATSTGSTGNSSLSEFTITGDSVTTGFTVNHAKNKQFVVVEVVRDNTPYDTIYTTVQRPNTNCILVNFDTAPTLGEQFKILIIS